MVIYMKLDDLVNEHYNELNLNDLHIWRYIVGHKPLCQSMSITELADNCNVSKTSILRFAKKLSLNGYSELKFYLKLESEEYTQVSRNFIPKICSDYTKAIQYLEDFDFTKACEMVHKANRIFAYGTGDIQQLSIMNLKRLFFQLNKSIYIVYGTDETKYLEKHIHEDDLVILYSLSGSSDLSIQFAQSCKNKKAKILSVTKLQDSPLSRLSDECIYFLNSFSNNKIFGHPFTPSSMFFITTEIFFMQYAMYLESLNE